MNEGRAGTRTGVLPIGKLPPLLLGRLLGTNAGSDESVLVGPGLGRDAAAIAIGGSVLVAKTDPITFASRDAAAYLVDINANDVACLGARPRWLLTTVLLAPGTTERDVEELFSDLTAVCERRGIALVGGHTEVAAGLDRTLLVGMMLGETTPGRLLRPGGARAGDRLLLTKGLAVEGTALLAREVGGELSDRVGAGVVARASRLLDDPGISVVGEAERLLAAGGVTALHDPTEGGLATAVREMAIASGCGAVIDQDAVPMLPETVLVAGALGIDPLGLLASGSLLVAAEPAATDRLLGIGAEAGFPITEIGWLAPADQGYRVVGSGAPGELAEFAVDEASRVLAALRGGGRAGAAE